VPAREPADAELLQGTTKPKSHFGTACEKRDGTINTCWNDTQLKIKEILLDKEVKQPVPDAA
jgi:hypothetical protein